VKSINLIPAYYLQARRRKVRTRAWFTICCVYAGLLGLTSLGMQMAWGSGDRAVADEVARVTRDVEQTAKALTAIQPELGEAQMQLEASRAVAVQPDWSVLLALMGKMRGPSIVLERSTLTPILLANEAKPVMMLGAKPGGATAANASLKKPAEPARPKAMNCKIEMSGLGRTQSDVSQFVLRLEQTGLFNRVKLVETNLSKFNNEAAVAFRLECMMSEGEKDKDKEKAKAGAGPNGKGGK